MSAHCCDHNTPKPETIVNLPRYRKILWVALLVNTAMFLIEIGAGVLAGSLSLLADAVDFAGDALNYAVSLAVLASALAIELGKRLRLFPENSQARGDRLRRVVRSALEEGPANETLDDDRVRDVDEEDDPDGPALFL